MTRQLSTQERSHGMIERQVPGGVTKHKPEGVDSNSDESTSNEQPECSRSASCPTRHCRYSIDEIEAAPAAKSTRSCRYLGYFTVHQSTSRPRPVCRSIGQSTRITGSLRCTRTRTALMVWKGQGRRLEHEGLGKSHSSGKL